MTALFWSDINPYGTFRLDLGKRLDLGLANAIPRPRAAPRPFARTATA
ncbi:hypothetical protein [Streptomyces sp. NPDC056628]